MAEHGDVTPYEIPRSRGVPTVVQWFFVVGIILIFFMGFISINGAGENHLWPAADTPKIDLSGKL